MVIDCPALLFGERDGQNLGWVRIVAARLELFDDREDLEQEPPTDRLSLFGPSMANEIVQRPGFGRREKSRAFVSHAWRPPLNNVTRSHPSPALVPEARSLDW